MLDIIFVATLVLWLLQVFVWLIAFHDVIFSFLY